MTKIGIIGATGTAGSTIFKEASQRGHEVTALVRNAAKAQELLGKNINVVEKDAFALTKADLEQFDVIVNAFGTPPNTAYLHVDLATKLVALFRGTTTPRLFFILGAGSLLDEKDELFVETIRKAPKSKSYISIPENQLKELNFLREVDNVEWVGVSPGAVFETGEAKPAKYGKNHILFNEQGESHLSSGTLANVILDEIESPKHHQERFHVIDNE
ncbi:NAD(P)H-binding protein [Desemzia sp. RIT804]|uniref:NAD(P)H-binding protein n=1 Tax=Desemzia sp. RIT 804 TaxID=2810209 RepID=UPI00194F8D72|nr:NAD(P)H-binding protein [Desemzia sp. RIT 804]MBM6613779.1 NAD(P)H-binding protein [Desemzia sp. RIT 804]